MVTSQVPLPNLCQIWFSCGGNHAVNYVLAPDLYFYSITSNQLTVTNLQNIHEHMYKCVYTPHIMSK